MIIVFCWAVRDYQRESILQTVYYDNQVDNFEAAFDLLGRL